MLMIRKLIFESFLDFFLLANIQIFIILLKLYLYFILFNKTEYCIEYWISIDEKIKHACWYKKKLNF